MIHLKSASEIAKIRESGRIVARTMRLVSEAIIPDKTRTIELDLLAERLIREEGGTPSFKGYRGYPATACISVNEEVIHGIPGERVLRSGDIVDLDFGVYKDGFHADAAWTFPVGTISKEAQRLLNVSREALNQGIAKACPGAKVGLVSSTIQKYVEVQGYSVVRELVGHGIGRELHEEPSVPNFGRPKDGPVLKAGTTICIEPMENHGGYEVLTLADGWTIVTKDGTLSAHFEHTVAVTHDGPELLTVE
ncbi:MAG: type I methionyl aminopeptidase [Fimbriimonadaceae bacterium]|nr:type I methionyl aminopeptidase [Fimbriimonadaceae bacterium]